MIRHLIFGTAAACAAFFIAVDATAAIAQDGEHEERGVQSPCGSDKLLQAAQGGWGRWNKLRQWMYPVLLSGAACVGLSWFTSVLVIKFVLADSPTVVQGPGPPGRHTKSVVMGSFFKALDGEVYCQYLLGYRQGQGPGIGFPWSLTLAIAPVAEGAAVTHRVALPVSSIMHNATGRRGPARVFHSVLDYNGDGNLAQ